MSRSTKHLNIKHVRYHSKNKSLSNLFFCAWEMSNPNTPADTKITIYQAWKDGLITLPINGSVSLIDALDYYERWPLALAEITLALAKPSISGA